MLVTVIPEIFPLGEVEVHSGPSSRVSAVVDLFCCEKNEIQSSNVYTSVQCSY